MTFMATQFSMSRAAKRETLLSEKAADKEYVAAIDARLQACEAEKTSFAVKIEQQDSLIRRQDSRLQDQEDRISYLERKLSPKEG